MFRAIHTFVAFMVLFSGVSASASESKKIEQCMGLSDYDAKTACLYSILAQDPEDVIALFTLRNERDRNLDQATFLQELNRLIEMRPDLAHLYLMRAEGLRKVFNDEEGAKADLEIAEYLKLLPDLRKTEAERPIEAKTENAPDFLARARARYFLGDYAGAIEDCNTYLRLGNEPFSPIVFDYLCSSNVAAGRIKGAIEALSQKLHYCPEYSESTLLRRAQLRRLLGDEAGATSDEKAARKEE